LSSFGETEDGEAETWGARGSEEEGEATEGKGTDREEEGERMFEGRRGERFEAEAEEAEFARADLSAGGAGIEEVSIVLTLVVVPISPGGNLLASFSRASASFFPKGPKPNAPPPPPEVVGGLISPVDVGGDPPLKVVELPPGEAARRSSPPDDKASIPSTESGENDLEWDDLTGEREAFA
jgi:hypothetical protein